MRHEYVFDSGSLGQLAVGNVRVEALLNRIRRNDGRTVVPAVVLAECCGDSRYDAGYRRALKALGGPGECIVAIDGAIALRAGAILRLARMRETIDAIIVAVAEAFGPATSVVTSDVPHMIRLTASANVKLGVIDTT